MATPKIGCAPFALGPVRCSRILNVLAIEDQGKRKPESAAIEVV